MKHIDIFGFSLIFHIIFPVYSILFVMIIAFILTILSESHIHSVSPISYAQTERSRFRPLF